MVLVSNIQSAQVCTEVVFKTKGARYIINSVLAMYRLHYFIYGVTEYEGYCILWYVWRQD